SNNTPEEILEESYNDLRQKLKRDLLERIKTNTPQFFESLVIDLMLAMGYGGSRRDAGEAVGRSGDGGIDGIIKEDRLGLNNIYIQAKRWENTVGRPEVQAFSGALDMHRANRGVFITTSQFSREAIEFVGRIGKKIILIDGSYLADLMIDYSVGVIIKETYIVYELNENYFDDE
ncbi:MAG: restriction endonuclease, partial [Chloroflexota bacterium]